MTDRKKEALELIRSIHRGALKRELELRAQHGASDWKHGAQGTQEHRAPLSMVDKLNAIGRQDVAKGRELSSNLTTMRAATQSQSDGSRFRQAVGQTEAPPLDGANWSQAQQNEWLSGRGPRHSEFADSDKWDGLRQALGIEPKSRDEPYSEMRARLKARFAY